MNKVIVSMFVLTFVFAFSLVGDAWSKAHVPQEQFQVCHQGIVKNVEKLEPHLGHGDCRLPACDGANIFVPGDSCVVDEGTEGNFCNVENEPEPAFSVRCAPGY